MALVRADISEERIYSIIRVARIGELGTALVVTVLQFITANVVPSSPNDKGATFLRNASSYKTHTP
jgi:hypothetical protein